ncbi:hypothetical protein [Amycolatopsis sp. NPDC051372]|uniref:hypothetical protein n=1 Tax=Amycolatopsis sp. NPDC051372 TaxID=3155669 RepID=UPI003432BB7A
MRLYLAMVDYAQGSSNAKVNAIGLGWSQTITPLPHHGLALFIDFDASEIGEIEADFVLLDDAGEVVKDPDGSETRVKLGMRPDVNPDAEPVATTVPLTLDIGAGMPLPAGKYRWRATVTRGNDVSETERPFTVRDQVGGQDATP